MKTERKVAASLIRKGDKVKTADAKFKTVKSVERGFAKIALDGHSNKIGKLITYTDSEWSQIHPMQEVTIIA